MIFIPHYYYLQVIDDIYQESTVFSLVICYNQSLIEMETAKQARASAKRLLTMAMNQVQSAIDQNMADEIITNRLLKAEQQMGDVMDKYQQY